MRFKVVLEMQARKPDLIAEGWGALQVVVEQLEKDGVKWVVVKA